MSDQSFQAFFDRLKSVSFIQNQSQLAHFLQVGRANVSLAKHKDQVPHRWIVTLARELNLNADWLARGKGPAHLEPQSGTPQPVHLERVEPRIDANGEFMKTEPNGVRTFQFDAEFLAPLGSAEQMVVLTVREEAMHPEIRSGDLALVDQGIPTVRPGRIHALGLQGDVLLRRLERLPHRTVIYADSPSHPSMEVRDAEWESIRLLGLVVLVCRAT
jgi:phage repressor protein C with HTH and peptisase S24 domain